MILSRKWNYQKDVCAFVCLAAQFYVIEEKYWSRNKHP